jgi:hypothetical protein
VSNHSSLPGSALRVKRKEKSNGLLPLYKLFELKNPHYFLSLFPTKNKKQSLRTAANPSIPSNKESSTIKETTKERSFSSETIFVEQVTFVII